jgi:hypothetical protein
MSRPRLEDTLTRNTDASFDQLVKQKICSERPSPERLAADLGCSVPALMGRIKGKPVRMVRILEWVDTGDAG